MISKLPLLPLSQLTFRTQLKPSDKDQVITIVRSSGFFSEEEIRIAGELVDEAFKQPEMDDYLFVFADNERELVGYSCYGRIPLTRSSFDLYWIAVTQQLRGAGIGRKLLELTEEGIIAHGGTQAYLDTSGRALYRSTRKFYEAAGYQPEAVLKDFYAPGDDKIIYRKTLVPCPPCGLSKD